MMKNNQLIIAQMSLILYQMIAMMNKKQNILNFTENTEDSNTEPDNLI